MQSRRTHLRGMLGMAALAAMPRIARAADQPVPPEGIGHRIKHVSYSDIGGRPDSIQIMSNRKHLYVGHMFSDGVTILDASDPRNPRPVNFFTAGQITFGCGSCCRTMRNGRSRSGSSTSRRFTRRCGRS